MDELGRPTNASLAALRMPLLATEGAVLEVVPPPPVEVALVVMEPLPTAVNVLVVDDAIIIWFSNE